MAKRKGKRKTIGQRRRNRRALKKAVRRRTPGRRRSRGPIRGSTTRSGVGSRKTVITKAGGIQRFGPNSTFEIQRSPLTMPSGRTLPPQGRPLRGQDLWPFLTGRNINLDPGYGAGGIRG